MLDGPTLITGAAGLLGQWLRRTAPSDATVVALTHRRSVDDVPCVSADLLQADSVVAAVAEIAPALVIHAAYARDEASIVDATRHVVAAAAQVGACVLYTSSDAVLGGDGSVHDEHAAPAASFDYGRWKGVGEHVVRRASPDNIIVRLPLLVSVNPDDAAVAQTRRAAVEGRTIRWYDDEHRRPAMAAEVATAIWRIAALPAHDRGGCWHLAGAERLSRYQIAERMLPRIGAHLSVIEPEHRPAESDRPHDLAFSDARARAMIGWDPSPIA